jgi:hypothetical protein
LRWISGLGLGERRKENIMSSHILGRIGISGAVVGAVLLAAGIVTSRAQADSWDKMTLLTVDQPTQVSDAYLAPGTYMLKLANSDRHIVQIFTKDRQHLIDTIIAIPSYRVNLTGNTEITFWETPPGSARAVREWFYPGDNDGQEFRYPAQLRQIAAVTPQPALLPRSDSDATPPAPVATEPETPAPQALNQAPAAEPAPPAEPVQIAQATPVETAQNAPQEIAQNNAPEAPAPQPQPQAADQTLPQTGSPYPLFGLCGILALGLYAGLRLHGPAHESSK